MSHIRGKHSKPELVVRRAAHRMGLRFRLHRGDLPGTPDLEFPSRKIALFVHGCFWHRHAGCSRASATKTRPEYWQAKFGRNIARDEDVRHRLVEAGWRVVVIWECETRNPSILEARLSEVSCSAKIETQLPKTIMSAADLDTATHNLKAVSSNLAPATKNNPLKPFRF